MIDKGSFFLLTREDSTKGADTVNMNLKGLIAAGLAVLGALTGCTSASVKVEESASYTEGDSSAQQRVELKADKLEKLDISSGSGAFTVHLEEDGVPYVQMKTKIRGIHIGPKPRLDVVESGNSTSISVKGGGWISFGSIRQEIDLYLPKDAVRELDVGIGSGSFYCGGMELDALNLRLASGEAVLDSVSAEEMGLYVSSGDFVLKDAVAGKVKAKLTSGEMDIETVGEPVALKASVSSGDFSFEGGISQGELGCTSGEIDVVSSTLPEALSCTVSSGDVHLELPEKEAEEAGFSIACKVSSGHFYNEFPYVDSEGKQVTGRGEKEYQFKITSGSIRLEPKR